MPANGKIDVGSQSGGLQRWGYRHPLSFTPRAAVRGYWGGNTVRGLLLGSSTFTGTVGSTGKGVVGSTGCGCTPRGHMHRGVVATHASAGRGPAVTQSAGEDAVRQASTHQVSKVPHPAGARLGSPRKGGETPILWIALSAMIHNHIGGREVGEGTGQHEGANDGGAGTLIAQLLAHGLPEYFQIGAGDFSEENDRIRHARPYPAFTSRASGKPHRARVRQYERLKFEHEQVASSIFSPRIYRGPPRQMERTMTDGMGMYGAGSGSWVSEPQLLTSLDDELSPFILPSPLPGPPNF
ncbi:hypothetical protein B0H14DRAFT_2644006 [Mycena olivaceomarginata]|nr:hypothetical protein B0H14DRAFT_2644006 [Mycena olivaceomarginata]